MGKSGGPGDLSMTGAQWEGFRRPGDGIRKRD